MNKIPTFNLSLYQVALGLQNSLEENEEESDEEDEEAVMDVNIGGSDGDTSGEDFEDYGEDDDEEEAQRLQLAQLKRKLTKSGGSNANDIEKEIKDEEKRLLEAWGSQRKAFYSTDYVDPDLGTDSDDERDADEEESEVNVLQARQVEALQEEDFDTLAPSTAKAQEVSARVADGDREEGGCNGNGRNCKEFYRTETFFHCLLYLSMWSRTSQVKA